MKIYSGKDVDDAISKGLKDLGVSKDNCKIEVLEYGSTGVFGLFRKEARVSIRQLTQLEKSSKVVEVFFSKYYLFFVLVVLLIMSALYFVLGESSEVKNTNNSSNVIEVTSDSTTVSEMVETSIPEIISESSENAQSVRSKQEVARADLEKFTVKNGEFGVLMDNTEGSFEFNQIKVLDTSIGKMLIIQYTLTAGRPDLRKEGMSRFPEVIGIFDGSIIFGNDEYKANLLEYSYTGAWKNYESEFPLSGDDFTNYPELKEGINPDTDGNITRSEQHPVGTTKTFTHLFYLQSENIKYVEIKSEITDAEIRLSIN